MERAELVPTALSQGESYHVFCSYSSTDYQWTHTLIQQLEQSGLRVCDHERDFTAGRPILNNMSESIQKSQKVLLVLSAEFVRSRWCLLEANMSMFRDCLQRKPIVPLLLQRDLPIPLHLAHLTYLEVQQPDFRQQLMRVLCTPNQEMQGSTVVPYQPPSFYNGKRLEPLSPVNDGVINEFDCGEWSTLVPQQLRLIIQQPQRYQEAIDIINTVSQTKVKYRTTWSQGLFYFSRIGTLVFGAPVFLLLYNVPNISLTALNITFGVCITVVALWALYGVAFFYKHKPEHILHELQKAVGQANGLLHEEHVLIGAQSNSKLFLVYVSVERCRQELSAQDQYQEGFYKAILEHSSEYTCCLFNRYFPFDTSSTSAHLEGGVCFCQFVIHKLSSKETKFRCFCFPNKCNS